MSIDYYEAEQEAAYDEFVESLAEELYAEHKDRAIDEFISERLKSYYLKNENIAIPAINFINKSKELVETDPTSSLMYSSVATEVVLKTILLKPVISGLVHTESLAELVSSTLVKQTGIDRFKKLVFEILENHIEFDDGIENYKRDGSGDNLWSERKRVQDLRNKIMHQAVFRQKEDAMLSHSVALSFFYLTELLIENVGLSFQKGGMLEASNNAF